MARARKLLIRSDVRARWVAVLVLGACGDTRMPAMPVASAPSLVQDVPEAPGANCAQGGEAIQVGMDVDGDGQLGPGEVTAQAYVCELSDTRVATMPEPAGARCSDGGQQILVGLDANGDDVLEPSEASTTLVACGVSALPAMLAGDYTIRNAYSAASLDGVTTITGNLTLDSPTLTRLHVPTLEAVGGMLLCSDHLDPTGCPQSRFDFPALQYAHIELDPTNPLDATSIALPSLQTGSLALFGGNVDQLALPRFARGQLDLDATGMRALDLPVFEQGTLSIQDEPSLATVSLPALAIADSLYIANDPAIQKIDLPALSSGTVDCDTLPALITLDAPVMLGGDVSVFATAQLQTLALPALTSVSSLWLQDNAALVTLQTPQLTSCAHLIIDYDAVFPTCAAQQLATQCHATSVAIDHTDDAATCP